MILRQVFLVFICILSMSSSCEKPPPGVEITYSIWIQNNSSKKISFLVGQAFPDTLVPNNEKQLLILGSGEEKTFDQKLKWKEFFNQLPADTLSLFFFNNDTINKYGFERIRNDYNILKRKDVSLADLKSNNFTITYP